MIFLHLFKIGFLSYLPNVLLNPLGGGGGGSFKNSKQLYKPELEVNYVILKGRKKFYRFKKVIYPHNTKERI